MAARAAAEMKYPITGWTPDMQAVLENEWEQMEGENPPKEPAAAHKSKDRGEDFDMK